VKWITRENANVDRIACPWLVKRFIDRDAEFLFVFRDQVLEVAEREGGPSYDAPGAEYTHRDGSCSFEVLVEEFDLGHDPALVRLAEIVHAADVAKDRGACPEGADCMRSRTGSRCSTVRRIIARSSWRHRCTTPSMRGVRPRRAREPREDAIPDVPRARWVVVLEDASILIRGWDRFQLRRGSSGRFVWASITRSHARFPAAQPLHQLGARSANPGSLEAKARTLP